MGFREVFNVDFVVVWVGFFEGFAVAGVYPMGVADFGWQPGQAVSFVFTGAFIVSGNATGLLEF